MRKAIFRIGNARFTVLTESLIRCEWSPDGTFEDGCTQTVQSRQFASVAVEDRREGALFTLQTARLVLRYRLDASALSPDTLEIASRTGQFVWRHGTPNAQDLPGTLRTLDNANGLENMVTGERHRLYGSIISRTGWTVLDDSTTLRMMPDGLLAPRTSGCNQDFYFFGYGRDYAACLRDYHQLTGYAPLPPKFVLGLWWSKWWPYRDRDLLEIVQQFATQGVPLSVCVVDMDWHTVYNPHHSGWTGYTWNSNYFADPEAFLSTLHAKGVHVCLNIHPHQGVAPHEAAYAKVCQRLGLDPAEGKTVPFQLGNPAFLSVYFEELHHPLEQQGVDFWWIDWQQGAEWDLPGVDPLWYLNHLHATNLARDGRKRPLIFSRWGDHSCHRYPVGFSGDTYAKWRTLNILPWFTAASANLGYGWRSDETGGFQRGDINDHELFTRWNQFACFSPTYRLHNCGDPGMDYRPWSKPAEYRDAILASMRLRRELLPYIYTAAYFHARGGPCLCRPMYQDYPDSEEAYLVPQQYMFGPDMIVAPFTRPADADTCLSRQVVWLPQGTWYDFFTTQAFEGGRFQVRYGGIGDIPVFVRAGAVVALQAASGLQLRVFPGSGSSFLYDDDGATQAWQSGALMLARIDQQFDGSQVSLMLSKADGQLPLASSYEIEGGATLTPGLPVSFPAHVRPWRFTRASFEQTLLGFRILGHTLRPLIGKPNIDFDPSAVDQSPMLQEIIDEPQRLLPYMGDFTPAQARCLLELLTDSGFHNEPLPEGGDALYYWCGKPGLAQAAHVSLSERFQYDYAATEWGPQMRHACKAHPDPSRFTVWHAQIFHGALHAFSLHK
jgi:hypothetical protein